MSFEWGVVVAILQLGLASILLVVGRKCRDELKDGRLDVRDSETVLENHLAGVGLLVIFYLSAIGGIAWWFLVMPSYSILGYWATGLYYGWIGALPVLLAGLCAWGVARCCGVEVKTVRDWATAILLAYFMTILTCGYWLGIAVLFSAMIYGGSHSLASRKRDAAKMEEIRSIVS